MGRKLKIEEMNRLSPEAYDTAEKIPVIILLDNIRSMNNVGSIFRTADSFRLEKVILAGITPTPPHREITKTAIGAELTVAWDKVEDAIETARSLQAEGYKILSIEQAEDSIHLQQFSVNPEDKYVLVLGHEISGVQQELIDISDTVLEIPQFGTKHSLNVSVASGIAMHHLAMGFWL